MTKIFLDTNIWLRFLLQDNQQAKHCVDLIKAIESGWFKAYLSNIVLLEINYVLHKIYKIEKKQVAEDIKTLLKTRDITIIEQTNSKLALNYYSRTGIKYSDCLIASQINKNLILCTYDQDFTSFKNLSIKTPDQLLKLI